MAVTLDYIKREIRLIIAGLENSMTDDFETYWYSDLENAVNDLEKLKQETLIGEKIED